MIVTFDLLYMIDNFVLTYYTWLILLFWLTIHDWYFCFDFLYMIDTFVLTYYTWLILLTYYTWLILLFWLTIHDWYFCFDFDWWGGWLQCAFMGTQGGRKATRRCENVSIMLFLKIMMVSDKTIHRTFSTHTTLLTKPIREFFSFSLFTKTIHWL